MKLLGFVRQVLLYEKRRVAWILGALTFLALAQGLLVLLIGPFAKTMFEGAAEEFITIQFTLPDFLSRYRSIVFAREDLVWGVPLGMGLAGIGKTLATYLYQVHQQGLSLFAAKMFRDRLFEAIIYHDYVRLMKKTPAEWMSILMNDVLFLQVRFSDLLNSALRDSVTIMSALVAISIVHPPMAGVLLIACPLLAYFMGKGGGKISSYADKVQGYLSDMNSVLLSIRKRFDFIKAQKSESFELNRFRLKNVAYFDFIKKTILLRAAFAPLMEFLGFSAFAVVLILYTRKIAFTELTGDRLLAFFAALGLMLRPLRQIGEQFARYQETIGALKTGLDILQSAPSPEKVGAPLIESLPDEVSVRRLAISIEGRFVVAGEDLVLGSKLSPKKIAIIGPSGSGKSTLLKCFAGLLEPTEWEANTTWKSVREAGVYIPQKPFLFSGSLKDNFLYGLNSRSVAANHQGLVENWLPKLGLNRVLGESGWERGFRSLAQDFSGGQIQRLALVRALVSTKSYWLLDESTSALDAATERQVVQVLLEAAKSQGANLVAVTHRLDQLVHFDEVWFVEQGEVRLKLPFEQMQIDPRYIEFAKNHN